MFKKAALSLCMLVCVIAGVFSMQFSGYAMPADPESDWSEEDGACDPIQMKTRSPWTCWKEEIGWRSRQAT